MTRTTPGRPRLRRCARRLRGRWRRRPRSGPQGEVQAPARPGPGTDPGRLPAPRCSASWFLAASPKRSPPIMRLVSWSRPSRPGPLGGPMRARCRVFRRPAPYRRPAARHQEEAGGRGQAGFGRTVSIRPATKSSSSTITRRTVRPVTSESTAATSCRSTASVAVSGGVGPWKHPSPTRSRQLPRRGRRAPARTANPGLPPDGWCRGPGRCRRGTRRRWRPYSGRRPLSQHVNRDDEHLRGPSNADSRVPGSAKSRDEPARPARPDPWRDRCRGR